MQDYVYKNQMAAYKYMQSVKDGEVKQFAQEKYHNDYEMQKYIYDDLVY